MSIAQTFTVDTYSAAKISGTGAYATKIDLYFAAKDATWPCTIELRTIEPLSGAITGNMVPFSRVTLTSAKINTSSNASKPTPFYFPSPVFLMSGVEYAVVVMPGANSPDYRLFVARLGENDITTGNRVVSQPAAGTMAVTSSTSFGMIQEEDLKFVLYIADFVNSSAGTLVLKNENRDYYTIANVSSTFERAGETIHGESYITGTFANTKTLSVANNTTFAQGVVSGATGVLTIFSASAIRVKSVTASAKFKGGERIRIRTNNATTGGIVGNSTGAVTAVTTPTGTMAFYDAVTASNTYLHLANVSYMNSGSASTTNRVFVANTFIRGQANSYTARIVSIDRLVIDTMMPVVDFLHPSNTGVTMSGKFATSSSARDTAYVNLNINENIDFDAPRYVLSASTESNTSLSSSTMASSRSAEFKFALVSTSRFSSPAIDLKRVSVTTVNNLINSNSSFGSSEDYTKTGGTASTRYITRRVTLADGQDAEDVRVYLTAYKPTNTDVHVYYKILHREDSDTFSDARWIPMTQTTAATRLSDTYSLEDFNEYQYDVPNYTTAYRSGANTTNSSILEYRNSVNARFTGFKYMAIKIVLSSAITTNPPRVRELRVIALQR